MQIRELMTPNAKACVPEDSCVVAGTIMRRHKCGFVSIVDSQRTKRVIGVVTTRDIVLCLVRLGRAASRVTMKACMTTTPETIASEASLEEAVRVMKKAAVTRLPVIERGKFVGVLSLQDIALAARRQWAYVGSSISEQHVTEILEAIAVARERQKVKSWR
ncbi:MAG: CBS domain-containing protein [Candidatus Omnitrophica bacterium]|nr:CBS domain-containing protein [Candidatus Omnitrophota bacterium]